MDESEPQRPRAGMQQAAATAVGRNSLSPHPLGQSLGKVGWALLPGKNALVERLQALGWETNLEICWGGWNQGMVGLERGGTLLGCNERGRRGGGESTHQSIH